jgi:CRP/FNR family cyclic AMP-dependent transcriptional regulator
MRKALHLLGILDDADIDWMVEAGSARSIREGTTLIREGVQIDAIYILLEGQLSVLVGGTDTTPGRQVATLFPGEIVGEISFVDTRPPVATVTLDRDSTLLVLPRAAIRSRLQTDVEFRARFYLAIASFLADRLYVTVGRFGYGNDKQEPPLDEIPESGVDAITMANLRFEGLVQRVLGSHGVHGERTMSVGGRR